MNLKVGDIVTYKFETVSSRANDLKLGDNVSYGIIESINQILTLEEQETFLIVNGNKVKESNVLSKVLTEKV